VVSRRIQRDGLSSTAFCESAKLSVQNRTSDRARNHLNRIDILQSNVKVRYASHTVLQSDDFDTKTWCRAVKGTSGARKLTVSSIAKKRYVVKIRYLVNRVERGIWAILKKMEHPVCQVLGGRVL
jgi:hypothetical protein